MKTLPARSALIVLGLICGASGAAMNDPVPVAAQEHKNGTSSSANTAHTGKHSSSKSQSGAHSTSPSGQDSGKEESITKAKAILHDIERLEHPEAHTPAGTPGWMEERNAASASFRQMLQSLQSKLIVLGPSISPLLAENLSSANSDVAQTCSNVLGQFGEASIPSIMNTVKKLGPQPMVVSALKLIGADCLPALGQMLQSSSDSERYSALKCIDSLLPDSQLDGFHRIVAFRHLRTGNNEIILPMSVVNQVCKITTKDKSVKFREEACILLGKVGPRSPQVAATLCDFARNDEQPVVRVAALAALGSVASSQRDDAQAKSIDVLVHALQDDDYDGARAEAATVLGGIPDASATAMPALLKAVNDGYNQVSAAACQALGNYGEKCEGSVPVLESLIKNKPNTTEACNAMRALGRMKSVAVPAMPTIVSCLKTGEPQIQTAALNAVESLGPLAAPAVTSLVALLSSQDIGVRYSVIRALGAIGPSASEAIPSLQEESKNHTNEAAMVNQALRRITGENSDSSMRRPILVAPPPVQGGSGSSI
ncbi:MAG TPA: HEAT repeat domain-containing protein [Oculatellaceae cyanobacterium]